MNDCKDILPLLLEEGEVCSTNNSLAERCTTEGVAEFTTLWADYQTAGKGQRGNRWESERGENLLFSMVLYPKQITAERQFLLSMAASTGVYSTLSKYLGKAEVSIKWPNDIYVGDQKIAGILIENDLMGSTISRCIVGIGININQEVFRSEAPNPVSLYQLTRQKCDRRELLQMILNDIIACYRQIDRLETDPATGVYASYLCALYRKKGFHPYRDANGPFVAELVSVEPDGHLHLKDEDGVTRTYAFKEVQYILCR